MLWALGQLTHPPNTLPPPEQSECIIANPAFVVYSSVVSFYVPFIVTLLVYIKIYIVLRRRRKRVNTKRSSRAFRANLKAPLKVPRFPSPPASLLNYHRVELGHPVVSGDLGHHSRRGCRLGELQVVNQGIFCLKAWTSVEGLLFPGMGGGKGGGGYLGREAFAWRSLNASALGTLLGSSPLCFTSPFLTLIPPAPFRSC